MKAREHYEAHLANFDSFSLGERDAGIYKLLCALSDEAMEIAKLRGSNRDSVMIAILEEQNDKWNCIARRWCPVLLRDGFLNFWKSKLPAEAFKERHFGRWRP